MQSDSLTGCTTTGTELASQHAQQHSVFTERPRLALQPTGLLFDGCGFLPGVKSGRELKLTSDNHPVPRLRVHEPVTPLH